MLDEDGGLFTPTCSDSLNDLEREPRNSDRRLLEVRGLLGGGGFRGLPGDEPRNWPSTLACEPDAGEPACRSSCFHGNPQRASARQDRRRDSQRGLGRKQPAMSFLLQTESSIIEDFKQPGDLSSEEGEAQYLETSENGLSEAQTERSPPEAER